MNEPSPNSYHQRIALPQGAPFAVFSDIHGNLPALEAVLADIRRSGIWTIFFLGDLINGVNPQGCLKLLRELDLDRQVSLVCVQGNAEMYLLTPDLAGLPELGMPWQADLVRLIDWFKSQLTLDDLAWIASWPRAVQVDGVCFCHDSPLDRYAPESWATPGVSPQYQEWFHHSAGIRPEMPDAEWAQQLEILGARQIEMAFCGHTHVPFQKQEDGRQIYNVGSAGAPLDGDPRAAWGMVTRDAGGDWKVDLRRLEYPIQRTHQMIDQTPDYPDFKQPGFREAYKKWFATGILWTHRLEEESRAGG